MWERFRRAHPRLYEAVEWGVLACRRGRSCWRFQWFGKGGREMLTTKTPPADREQVVAALEGEYGSEQLWQVERLSRHIFRAWLRSSQVAIAIVMPDGDLSIKLLKDPA